jgi:hypothetical protein
MLKRLFGATEGASASSGSSGGAGTSNAGRQSAIETLANLKETLAMLEKREVRWVWAMYCISGCAGERDAEGAVRGV